MIPAPAGTYAMYLSEKTGDRPEYCRVVAFNDDGQALIISPKSGSLVVARTYKSPRCARFCGVSDDYDSPGRHRYTSIIPGGEWLMHIELGDEANPERVRCPVDFWATTETGEIVPVVIDEDGTPWASSDDKKFKRVLRTGT